ncbi:MAG TPA: translocation/assembly module TamB domain-containing protein [Flavitalea sp.]|nr:translocation/assembly module TamB domain-containing protein [Flavitalea sp.]
MDTSNHLAVYHTKIICKKCVSVSCIGIEFAQEHRLRNFKDNTVPLKKFWKISRTILLVLLALVVLTWLLIQTSFVQNYIVKRITKRLSKDLHTEVSIRHVDFALFNKMLLEGTLIKDQQKDTLLYAGAAKVRITDWFFFKEKIELEYIGLQDAVFHLQRTGEKWNYQFLIDYFSTPAQKDTSSKSIELNLKQVELDNVAIVQRDGWRGENLALTLKALDLDAERINFKEKVIRINTLSIQSPSFAVYNYTGHRPARNKPAEDLVEIINDPKKLRWNAAGWQFQVDELSIVNGTIKSEREKQRPTYESFDGEMVLFSKIDATFRNLQLEGDSLNASLTLRAKERSGFEVKSMTADFKMHPEAFEFSKLDLRTNRSHLTKFFAMRFQTIDDLNRFVSKVQLEADFDEAVIDSDDIAYFAPNVSNWNKKIKVSGHVKGTIDNLNGKNLEVEAGRDTYLNGNISLAGLPDITKTFIDFEANAFRTTYKDAVSFVPQLRDISQPRLDLLQYLHFKGNFTGFLQDFVTYGTLETALGTIITDLNMKFPTGVPASYSGTVKTSGFQLGSFIDNSQLGKASFEGKVNGSGMRIQTLNAKLDGTIRYLEFNNYPYQNITVRGTIAKKLFNGELISYDPNLDARLNGLIDFTQKVPNFNFDAFIIHADLRKLNLIKDNLEFDGKFHFNFSGDNIDNFLGNARIYEASLFKSGKRITFDSLSLESKIIDNNKVITLLSNEFDAALVGEFSIKDLPGAFQSFLNKYYPTYIRPAKSIAGNQNFSFVISTKQVDEYVDLFVKNLSGFNNSTITGRINTRENLLDLNAEIPQFSYKNISISDLNLKSTGTMDSLSITSNIGNVSINDSLNFPGTVIRINSANDLSEVNIKTSANQTLNAADISAQVQTLPKGVKIRFKESNFDLNGKNWTIEKNGELVFTDVITADGVKMYNGEQEILVSSVPSDIGNTNDIQVNLRKVNIGDFSSYFIKANRLEGLVTGTVTVGDPFGKMNVDIIGETEQFRLDDDSIGRIQLNANYNSRNRQINLSALSDNENYRFDIKGLYALADSARKDRLDFDLQLNETKIDLLQQYISGVFSDLKGLATGNIKVTGPSNKIGLLGTVQLRDAGLKVIYTDVYYTIPSATISLQENMIDFGSFRIEDKFQNKGQVTNGKLYHTGFNDLAFDFSLNTNKLLVLATSNAGNNPFYGNVIARANMRFHGPLEAMQMDIEGEPADSSSLYIDSKSGRESGSADFLVWKVYGREMQDVSEKKESNLTINLDVTANEYVNMYVILDELTGDIIKANGRGNLKMRVTTDGEFTINGRYDIDRGNYNFNFQSLLKKPFKLRENAGNYILWTGDPSNASIKIDAEYEAENVRFSDLGLDEVNNNVKKYRGKVLVVASLTGDLMSPIIRFQLQLPPGSALINDPDAIALLQRIQNDENELNKQVAFLIVFNSFGPLATSSNQGNLGGIAFEGIVVNSISGVLSSTLSRQFSNIFQKIFNDKSIRVNFNAQLYSGTNFVDNTNRSIFNVDRTNLNLSIGKSLFNERLTFTFGSAVDFGLSSAQVNATRNLPFLPDISAEWKLSPDGKLLLTFFYRDSYNYLTGAGVRQNRSGASISYRKEFDSIGELLGNDKKKKKKPLVPVTKAEGN